MGDSNLKEINFVEYCRTCKYRDKKDYEPPCDECLEVGMRKGTCVPERWDGNKK